MSAEPTPPASTGGGPLARTWRWLDDRYGLADLVAFARHKRVPVGEHSMLWYYLGGVTMFFFLVQIATGVLLLMYYQAGESTSYESMRYLVTKVPFGWLVRSVHCWSAHLMVLTLLLHMWSVFFLKAYRKPREITWFSGIGLFGLALGFGFSGYLLPWNELSYFATAVGTDSVKSIPVIGQWMLRVLRGGDEVSIRTLYRFYALHVCILPMATFGLVGLHILLVQKQGMAAAVPDPAAPPKPRRAGMPFFPNFALRDLLLWVLAVNLLALLAVLLPYGPGIPGAEWELGMKADPLKPAYPGIKPEWYFLWMYQLLKEFPAHIFGLEGSQVCLFVSSILMGIWFAIPFLDRSAQKNRPSPAFTDFGVAILTFLGFLMLKAWDVGVDAPHGVDPNGDPAMARTILHTAAGVTLAAGVAALLFRRLVLGARFFAISVIALLQVVLHGFFGVSYLAASAACLVLLAGVLVFLRFGRKATPALPLLALVILGTAGAAAAAEPVDPRAAERNVGETGSLPEERWPSEWSALIDTTVDGKRVVPEAARKRFSGLPAHSQTTFFEAQKKGLLDSPEQLATLLGLEITPEHVELLVSDNCVLCHTSPNQQGDETLFRLRDEKDPLVHLDLREVASDVHLRRGLSCSGCHGGKPTDTEMTDEIRNRWPDAETRKKDRTWIPDFCTSRCHAVAAVMRRYNPSLPIDQMLKYRESRHGELLLEKKDSKAAQCVSCHGVHGIRRPTSPRSQVYPLNIPDTCGHCHADEAYMRGYTMEDGTTPIPTDQLERYRNSVHGRALFEKNDLGAPVCNSCHGNHAAMPPAVSAVSQICRNCHVNNGKLFDGSPHKAAFESYGWPECETCHGKHDIQKPTDEMLGVGPQSVCRDCHENYGQPVCNETAEYFHDRVTGLVAARAKLDRDLRSAEEGGQDLTDLRFRMEGLDDAIIEARSRIHTFNRTEFDSAAKKGADLEAGLRKDLVGLSVDHRSRKIGLVVSTLLVTLFAAVLWLKIRRIDVENGPEDDGPPGS